MYFKIGEISTFLQSFTEFKVFSALRYYQQPRATMEVINLALQSLSDGNVWLQLHIIFMDLIVLFLLCVRSQYEFSTFFAFKMELFTQLPRVLSVKVNRSILHSFFFFFFFFFFLRRHLQL